MKANKILIDSVIVNKNLDVPTILKLLEKVIPIGQMILLDEAAYERIIKYKKNDYRAFQIIEDVKTEPDILIYRNEDTDFIKYRNFINLNKALSHINTYSSNERILKYELNEDGFVIYKVIK